METVGIREFSRRVGVSDTTIRKAIAGGLITSVIDVDTKRPKLIFDAALKEWNDSGGGLSKLNTAAGNEKPKSAYIPKLKPVYKEPVKTSITPTGPEQPLTVNNSIVEAKRQSAIINSKLLGLELAKEQKLLVSKAEVYKKLFEFGQSLKLGLLAIPDRVTDQMMSVTRNEAHTILVTAITEELRKLSDTSTMEF